MKKLLALTAVFIGGIWYKPGAEVPGDRTDFNYEKAARKGLLTSVDGEPVVNPSPAFDPSPLVPATPSAAPVSASPDVLPQLAQVLGVEADAAAVAGAVQDLREAHESVRHELSRLQGRLEQVQADHRPDDVAELAEYRLVVGPLLPKGTPGRKALLDNGYLTPDAVQAAEDQTLLALNGIAEKSLAELRKAFPFIGNDTTPPNITPGA